MLFPLAPAAARVPTTPSGRSPSSSHRSSGGGCSSMSAVPTLAGSTSGGASPGDRSPGPGSRMPSRVSSTTAPRDGSAWFVGSVIRLAPPWPRSRSLSVAARPDPAVGSLAPRGAPRRAWAARAALGRLPARIGRLPGGHATGAARRVRHRGFVSPASLGLFPGGRRAILGGPRGGGDPRSRGPVIGCRRGLSGPATAADRRRAPP